MQKKLQNKAEIDKFFLKGGLNTFVCVKMYHYGISSKWRYFDTLFLNKLKFRTEKIQFAKDLKMYRCFSCCNKRWFVK